MTSSVPVSGNFEEAEDNPGYIDDRLIAEYAVPREYHAPRIGDRFRKVVSLLRDFAARVAHAVKSDD